MTETIYSWAPITKSEKQDDGTLLVYGPAATSALDRDNQRLDAAWLNSAMPRWMTEGGGVREQHDSKRAVGVGVGLSKSADGAHMLTARIVDPIAVKKIEYGVLRGFSVGIKNPRIEMGKADAPKGLVTDGDVIEVSVVDRPANGECVFALAKADAAGDLVPVEDPHVIEKSPAPDTYGLPADLFDGLAAPVKQALADLAASGAQVAAEAVKADSPDEPTPLVVNVTVLQHAAPEAANSEADPTIKTKADLRKAVKAVDLDPQRDALRKHITTRAKALGLEAMVPEHWNKDESPTDAAKAQETVPVPAETVEKAEAVLRDVRALIPDLAKADKPGATPGATVDGNAGDGGSPSDIDGATAAIAAIAALIVSEAQSLAQGNFNELVDIRLLMEAASALKYFVCREQAEDPDGGSGDMTLAESATLLKAANANLAPPFKKKKDGAQDGDGSDTPAATGDDAAGSGNVAVDDKPSGKKKDKKTTKADEGEHVLTKAEAAEAVRAAVEAALAKSDTAEPPPAAEPDTVTKAELEELVKAAVAEARTADEERIKALAVDVAKASVAEAVKDLPQPGGPVLTRTAAQQGEATKSDAALLRAQADALMAKADAFPANPDLAQGYRDRARALLAKAAA